MHVENTTEKLLNDVLRGKGERWTAFKLRLLRVMIYEKEEYWQRTLLFKNAWDK